MSHKIEIGLDIGEVKKSLFEINNLIERTFGKTKGYGFISKDSEHFITDVATKALAKIKSQMADLAFYAEKHHKALKDGNLNEKETILNKSTLLRLEKDRLKLANDM